VRIGWHPLARRELLDAVAYYDNESSGLGSAFLDAVHNVVERLETHPHSGTSVDRQNRRGLVSRFPYQVIYQLDRSAPADRLFILALAHSKRRPRYWAGRVDTNP